MTIGVQQSDGAALTEPYKREAFPAQAVGNCLKVSNPRFHALFADILIGQPATTDVEASEGVALG